MSAEGRTNVVNFASVPHPIENWVGEEKSILAAMSEPGGTMRDNSSEAEEALLLGE